MTRNRYGISFVAALVFAAGPVGYWLQKARAAGIPAAKALIYTGTLTEGGTPVTGTRNIQISVANQDGSQKCVAGPSSTAVQAGAFQVALPDACTALVHQIPDLSMEIFVGGASMGKFKLGAVPYAVEALYARDATSAAAASSATGELDTRLKTFECPDPAAPQKYGFCIWHDVGSGTNTQTYKQALATCKSKGGRMCTSDQAWAAAAAGAVLCARGWIGDVSSSLTQGTVVQFAPLGSMAAGCARDGFDSQQVGLTETFDALCCK